MASAARWASIAGIDCVSDRPVVAPCAAAAGTGPGTGGSARAGRVAGADCERAPCSGSLDAAEGTRARPPGRARRASAARARASRICAAARRASVSAPVSESAAAAAAAAAAVALVSEAARVVRCISRCAATCAARFSPRGSGASRGPRSGGGDTGTSRIEVDKGPRDREIHTQHGHTPMTYQAAGHAPRPAHGPLLVQRLLLVLFNGEAQVHGIANDLRCECMHVRGRRPRVGAKKACRLSRTDRAPRARPCSWSEWPGTRRGADPADRASQSRCLGQPRPRTPEPHQVIHLHLARKQVL